MTFGLSILRSDHRGFTLVELLVVIAIIGVLAAIVVPNAFKSIEKAKVARAEADLKAFKAAALNYYTDTGKWPEDKYPGEDPGFVTNEGNVNGWNGPYLERWPASTPFGGQYDWDKWSDRAGITIAHTPNLTDNLMLLIDRDMDDGNLASGNVVKLDYGLQVILQRW
ncbi:type II secretion system protein [Neomoorella thermoacetica]|nr:prepilin-type N-terminal cleavage/methylation domain-containing protein [Moorella thermoacetica]